MPAAPATPPHLHARLGAVLRAAAEGLGVPAAAITGPPLERPRDPAHGDCASGLALRLAKPAGQPPRAVAAVLAAAVESDPAVAAVAIAGPGFVNLTLTAAARGAVIADAIAGADRFGRQPPNGESYLLEFVSANPTGPLHVGHGRAAAHGDSLARILRHAGAAVTTEYYLNDRGLQADVLAASLWLRVLRVRDPAAVPDWPAGAYAGDYLVDVAHGLERAHPGLAGAEVDLAGLPDEPDACARELAGRAKAALGEAFATVRAFAVTELAARIKDELAACRVTFDRWFSEAEMAASGAVDATLADLAARDLTYEHEGATWLRASRLGDDKDWVVVRSTGEQTYLAADIAYHADKARRCAGTLYDLLGADHHGYVARLHAALAAVGEDPQRLEVGIMQLVSLVNAGDRIKMSTRAGKFHALADLVAAVGADAVRLAFVRSKIDAALEFDVARVTRMDPENPVYYLQYAHARSCRLLAKWGGDVAALTVDPDALTDAAAVALLTELLWFVPTLQAAARERAPHRIAHWLVALASALHSYYDKVPVLAGDEAGRPSRLALVAAARNGLATGLGLLGVDAPNTMGEA